MYKIIIIFACFAVAGFLGVSNWRKLKAASEFRSTASVSKSETTAVASASVKSANGLPAAASQADSIVWPQVGEWPDGVMKIDFVGKVFRWEKLVAVETEKARGWWHVVTEQGEYERGVATPYGVPLVFDGACVWLQQSNLLARIFVGREGQRGLTGTPVQNSDVPPSPVASVKESLVVPSADLPSVSRGGGEPRRLADSSRTKKL